MSVDTLTLAQRLRAAELPANQAEAIGAAVLEGAATKDDLVAVKAELKGDMGAVKAEIAAGRAELKGDIAALRTELKADIASVRTDLELKIEQLRTEIVRGNNQLCVRTISTQTALLGLFYAAIKLL